MENVENDMFRVDRDQGRIRTEAVDEQVVPVIFPEDFYLTGSFSETEAVDEEEELDA